VFPNGTLRRNRNTNPSIMANRYETPNENEFTRRSRFVEYFNTNTQTRRQSATAIDNRPRVFIIRTVFVFLRPFLVSVSRRVFAPYTSDRNRTFQFSRRGCIVGRTLRKMSGTTAAWMAERPFPVVSAVKHACYTKRKYRVLIERNGGNVNYGTRPESSPEIFPAVT